MLKNLDYQIAKFTIFEPMVQMQVKKRERGQGEKEKDFQSYALRAKKIKIDLEWLKNKLRIEISSKIPKKDKKIGKGDRDREKKKVDLELLLRELIKVVDHVSVQLDPKFGHTGIHWEEKRLGHLGFPFLDFQLISFVDPKPFEL